MSTQNNNNNNIPSLNEKYSFIDISDLAQRVSTNIASNEKTADLRLQWQEIFYNIIFNKEFMPSGNTLSGGVYSSEKTTLQPNCCVIGEINDMNREEIIDRSIVLWKKAIGIGFFINSLDPVKTLEELSNINNSIVFQNRPKRGNMAVISIDHPRFYEVASYKAQNQDNLSNFNISVSISNEFMEQLKLEEADEDTRKNWRETSKSPKEWLMTISELACKCGDPGIVFIDRVQNANPQVTTTLGRIITAVPCGEQFLHTNETCNLGVVNLNAPSLYNEHTKSMDWTRMKHVVSAAVRFLDNVVDLLEIPDEKMRELSRECRRIGLGVGGWADLLEKQGIPYDSPEALHLALSISQTITEQAKQTSCELALEKGECPHRKGFRNISLTCIQPTGGITALLGNRGYCIEPFFSEANGLSTMAHVRMQASWQKNIEQGISKTINMPNEATPTDVFNAYVLAFDNNCKGITVYRDGCKSFQPIKCKTCEEGSEYCPVTRM